MPRPTLQTAAIWCASEAATSSIISDGQVSRIRPSFLWYKAFPVGGSLAAAVHTAQTHGTHVSACECQCRIMAHMSARGT